MELREHVSTECESAIEKAGFKAAERYLTYMGYEVIAREYCSAAGIIDIVARSGLDGLVFATVYVGVNRMPNVRTIDEEARYSLEKRAMSYLADQRNDVNDMSVTFDCVYVGLICSQNGSTPTKALIRHHRNVLATPWDQETPTDPEGGLTLGAPFAPRDIDGPIRAADVDDPDGELLPESDDEPPFDEE